MEGILLFAQKFFLFRAAPSGCFRGWQNDCNLMLHLTSEHVFENIGQEAITRLRPLVERSDHNFGNVSNVFKLCPTHFSRRAKFCLVGFTPPAPLLLRA